MGNFAENLNLGKGVLPPDSHIGTHHSFQINFARANMHYPHLLTKALLQPFNQTRGGRKSPIQFGNAHLPVTYTYGIMI